jgi:hypothetical protein
MVDRQHVLDVADERRVGLHWNTSNNMGNLLSG